MSDRAEIFEVGPRDGLQNEAARLSVRDKIALVDLLSQAGFSRIEVASFVSPRWVPQMVHSGEVLRGIKRAPGVSYAALTPNLTGFERAMDAGADEIAIFAAASEGFSRANINCSISESLDRFAQVADAAFAANVRMRGYISMVIECPYDGVTPPARVAELAESLLAMGVYEISLGDTLGRGTPEAVRAMLEAVLAVVPADRLAGHFHDTSGHALANIEVALDIGLRVFDAAVGGLGGCPYAPGAAGNVATEAVAGRLAALGIDTGLDGEIIARAAAMSQAMRAPGRAQAARR